VIIRRLNEVDELLADQIFKSLLRTMLIFDTSGGFALFNPDFTPVPFSLFLKLLFAIVQDLFSLLFVQQIKSQMCGNITEYESHEWSLLQIVINSFRVGIHNVVGKIG
jgi:hypothetical protein